jgi:ABC-type transport system substrate-binding protein
MLDMHHGVDPPFWSTLEETAPDLLSKQIPGSGGVIIAMQNTEPPFDDVNVRRALMIGTDREAVNDLEGIGTLPLHWYPMSMDNPDVYTPLEDLPENIRILYDYDPELAVQMLEDALGPPDADGFYITCDFSVLSQPSLLDRAALLKDMWDDIGVNIEIKSLDLVTIQNIVDTKEYHGLIHLALGMPFEFTGLSLGKVGNYYNWAVWEDAEFEAMYSEASSEMDATVRNALVKDASLILLENVPYLPLNPTAERHWWWPWIKNYYGEKNAHDYCISPILAHAWLDQDLKTAMGY